MTESKHKLKGKQARYLRGLGHSMKPLLQVGKSGITESFITQLKSALETHELLKVKVGKSSPSDLKESAEQLASKVPCQVAQSIGKTLLLYKERTENPTIVLPS